MLFFPACLLFPSSVCFSSMLTGSFTLIPQFSFPSLLSVSPHFSSWWSHLFALLLSTLFPAFKLLACLFAGFSVILSLLLCHSVNFIYFFIILFFFTQNAAFESEIWSLYHQSTQFVTPWKKIWALGDQNVCLVNE